jgi:hypothetical protein
VGSANNPPFNENIIDDSKRVARGWITWFTSVSGGGAVSTPTVGASPFTYKNGTIIRQQVLVTGGTVSSVQLSRDNSTFVTLPANQAVLFPGDYLKITYTVLPTLTVFPI